VEDICIEVKKMEEDWKERYLYHLERVSGEIEKMKKELGENPDGFGDFENRLYWAIKGIDPRKAICSKHNRKLHKNDYGEFICGGCAEDIVEKARAGVSIYDENIWFDPDDEPTTKIKGIRYGR